MSVSYTHLDVYKRQEVESAIDKITSQMDSPIFTIDVYKRQVEDNGCGFSPEMLASFPVKEDNCHVGLSNLYHTLQLIYGPAASLHISNAEPNGARVTIFLPE